MKDVIWRAVLAITGLVFLVACSQTQTLSVTAPAAIRPQPEDKCLTEEQVAQMSRNEITARETFCFTRSSGATVTIHQPEAVESIRAIMGLPDLRPVFETVNFVANSPNADLYAALYSDEEGRTYKVDLNSSRVVEIDASRAYRPPSPDSSQLTEEELRAKAQQMILDATPDFAEQRDKLVYEEGTKPPIYFFRWEDRTSGAWSNMLPLAQVGLSTDGQVVNYINTLFLQR